MGDHRHVASELERLAGELHDAAFGFMEPARSPVYAEHRIARVGAALERGLAEGVVHQILRQQPVTIPDFIHQEN